MVASSLRYMRILYVQYGMSIPRLTVDDDPATFNHCFSVCENGFSPDDPGGVRYRIPRS